MVKDQVLLGPDGTKVGYNLIAIYYAMKIVGVQNKQLVYLRVKELLLEDE